MPRRARQPLLQCVEVIRSRANRVEVEVAVVADIVFDPTLAARGRLGLAKARPDREPRPRRPLVRMRAVERRLGRRREARVTRVHPPAPAQREAARDGALLRSFELGAHADREVTALGVDHTRARAEEPLGVVLELVAHLVVGVAADKCHDAARLRAAHHRHLNHLLQNRLGQFIAIAAREPQLAQDDHPEISTVKPRVW